MGVSQPIIVYGVRQILVVAFEFLWSVRRDLRINLSCGPLCQKAWTALHLTIYLHYLKTISLNEF